MRRDISIDTEIRLQAICDVLNLQSEGQALDLAVIKMYEAVIEQKISEIDQLLPITSRLDRIENALAEIIPEF